MPASQTAAIALPLRKPAARFGLIDFLRRELAPFPGRTAGTLRVVVTCVAVLVICMTLRVPEAYLSVWVVTRFAMEESSQTILTAIVFLVALTVGLAIPLVLLTFAMDQAWLRFCLMATMAALGLFLRRTFVIGALGFVIGLIGTMAMTVPDFIRDPELAVRFTLWLWPVFALGVASAAVSNLLIAPSDPEVLLRSELVARLRATEQVLAGYLGDDAPEEGEAARLAWAGVARLLVLLKSAGVAHPWVRAQEAQFGAVITLADRLVAGAAALELLSNAPLRADERQRLRRVAEDCARLSRALEARRAAEAARPTQDVRPPASGGSAILPVIVELENAVDLLRQALGPDEVPAEAPSESDRRGLFAADAFTNPAYLRYALKGALAVMICYVLQSAVNWPGIRTCLITCLIVGLQSEGATIQKGTLRITGALVGGLLGFLAILFLIPGMESITSLALVVACGTAVAAWVVVGSPRISYAGVQIALAFYIGVIQGFAPTWYFYTLRDRMIGILLGNAVITAVFYFIWPVEASSAMWPSLASALRTMARLATVGSRSDDQRVVSGEVQALRTQACRDFAAAQQLADEAAFEPSAAALNGRGAETRAAREQLQRIAAEAQSVLLTQLAVARQRPNVALVELPDDLVHGVRAFDAVVARSLAAIADRVEHDVTRVVPDLRLPLAAVSEVVRSSLAKIPSAEVAAQAEARLSLYGELVPRIERLAAAEVAP